ncbi:unnamed protein product [Ceutorhynchus assimilis]|uniref:Uncharacterized protein n=1 Tax=Ceutorhynchus assimilis TaxID=467358 RepID=A0A9N9QJ64_9CUCU|nr:unnamed protein product [Ceutorhynchus assimilis]
MSEHKRSIRPANILNTNNKTALAEHFEVEQHAFDFDNVAILGKQINYKKRLLNEMIEIRKHPYNINKKQDVEGLSMVYHNLLKTIQHPT